MGARVFRRMNRQKRERAKPGSDRGEDHVQCIGPMDHHKPAPGREHREGGLNPVDKARARHHMRALSAFVRRGADRRGVEEGRVGEDAIGRFNEPRLASLPWVKRVEPQDAGARLNPIARSIAFGKERQLRINFNKIDGRKLGSLRQRQPDRAHARADIDDPALPSLGRRRNQKDRVRPDPMAALRLEERKLAAKPQILGQAMGRCVAS